MNIKGLGKMCKILTLPVKICCSLHTEQKSLHTHTHTHSAVKKHLFSLQLSSVFSLRWSKYRCIDCNSDFVCHRLFSSEKSQSLQQWRVCCHRLQQIRSVSYASVGQSSICQNEGKQGQFISAPWHQTNFNKQVFSKAFFLGMEEKPNQPGCVCLQ